LRSTFLTKVGISTEAFVGSNDVIGFMVDNGRIATYAALFMFARQACPFALYLWSLIAAECLPLLESSSQTFPTDHMRTVRPLPAFCSWGSHWRWDQVVV
jgi:hypothetical protein